MRKSHIIKASIILFLLFIYLHRVLLIEDDYTSLRNNTIKTLNDFNIIIEDEFFEFINEICNDVSILTTMVDYENIIYETDDIHSTHKIEQAMEMLIKKSSNYISVKFVDVSNNERIGYRGYQNIPFRIPKEELGLFESKEHLKYISNLDNDEIYISEIKLEQSKIMMITPVQPVMYYSKRVYDTRGNNIGYIVLEVNAYTLFNSFKVIDHLSEDVVLKVLSLSNSQYVYSSNEDEMFTSYFNQGKHTAETTLEEIVWEDELYNGVYHGDNYIGYASLINEASKVFDFEKPIKIVGKFEYAIGVRSYKTFYNQSLSQFNLYNMFVKSVLKYELLVVATLIVVFSSIVDYVIKKHEEKHEINEYKKFVKNIVLIAEDITADIDENTGNHIHRVGEISKMIAIKLGLNDLLCDQIGEFAPLHDLGKIGVPDSILNKPGKLTPEEFEVIKKHVTFGYNIVSNLSISSVAKNIILYHHEKWNGKGYKKNMSGIQIPIEARIVAVADVYDALRSKRPYKNEFTHEEAVRIIKKESGMHFDPDIVNVFLEIENEIKKVYNDSIGENSL